MKQIKLKYKISIRNKLLLYFSLLILLTVGAQLFFNFFVADEVYTLYKKVYMERAFYDLEEIYDGDLTTIEAWASDIENTENIQLLIAVNGENVYMTSVEMENYLNVDEEVEDNRPLSNIWGGNLTPKAIEIKIPTTTDEIVELVGSFTYSDEEIHVRMTLPVASIESTTTFFTNAYILIGGFILVLGILLALRLSRSITKPIVDIEKVSQDLSNLNFVEYASEDSGTKEIASLGQSINRMSQELESRIIELNEANEKLQKDVDYQLQAEQMRKEFVANVSHEMKTPLAILQFYCENLKSDIDGIDKTYYLDTIIEETKRMDAMVKSMLDLSSLENGLTQMVFEDLSLSDVVNHTVDKLNPLLDKFDLCTEIEENICVNGDRQYLEQALSNYINNAILHTEEGNKIQVTLEKRDKWVRCTVFNVGDLIEESQLERIWESFHKIDKSRVRKGNANVGLGLHIVKCVIENHDGNYGVNVLENGVEFYFEMPVVSES